MKNKPASVQVSAVISLVFPHPSSGRKSGKATSSIEISCHFEGSASTGASASRVCTLRSPVLSQRIIADCAVHQEGGNSRCVAGHTTGLSCQRAPAERSSSISHSRCRSPTCCFGWCQHCCRQRSAEAALHRCQLRALDQRGPCTRGHLCLAKQSIAVCAAQHATHGLERFSVANV